MKHNTYPLNNGRSLRALLRFLLCVFTLFSSLMLGSVPHAAYATPDTVSIILYTADGTTDMSALYTYTNHLVYDPETAQIIGTVSDDGYIHRDTDTDQSIIGYVTVAASTSDAP